MHCYLKYLCISEPFAYYFFMKMKRINIQLDVDVKKRLDLYKNNLPLNSPHDKNKMKWKLCFGNIFDYYPRKKCIYKL